MEFDEWGVSQKEVYEQYVIYEQIKKKNNGQALAECGDIWLNVSEFLTLEDKLVFRKISLVTRRMYWNHIGHLPIFIQGDVGLWKGLDAIVQYPNINLRSCQIKILPTVLSDIKSFIDRIVRGPVISRNGQLCLSWNMLLKYFNNQVPLWIGELSMNESNHAVPTAYEVLVQQFVKNIMYKLSSVSETIEYVFLDISYASQRWRTTPYKLIGYEYDPRGIGINIIDDGLCDFGSHVNWNSYSMESFPIVDDDVIKIKLRSLLCSELSVPDILHAIKSTNIPTRISSLFWNEVHSPHTHINEKMWKKCKSICIWVWEMVPELIPEKYLTQTLEMVCRPSVPVGFIMDNVIDDTVDTIEIVCYDISQNTHIVSENDECVYESIEECEEFS
jgi:hypothetical protein